MKKKTVTGEVCGKKFAARYGLDAFARDFWFEETLIVFPDSLPDDPITEAPDPEPPLPQAAITNVKTGTATDKEKEEVLKYLLDRLGL